MLQDSQPSIVDTANQQAANMIAIDAANDAARREQAIQLANVKQSNSGQASPAGASSPKSVPLWIAIAFSTLGDETNNFGGDGAWGVAVNQNAQTAINQSKVECIFNSHVPNWCGAANGGRFATCTKPGMTSS